MSTIHRRGVKAALAALVLATGVGLALAAPGSFDVGWDSLGPGGPASGGAYTLDSAVPHDGGLMSGGPYALAGGYWGEGAATYAHTVYLPLVTR
jgi:hypothetical protein